MSKKYVIELVDHGTGVVTRTFTGTKSEVLEKLEVWFTHWVSGCGVTVRDADE